MSALAHPGPIGLLPSPRRRRHLALVPATAPAEQERLAEVVVLPVPAGSASAARSTAPARDTAGPRAAIGEAPLRLTVRGRRVLAALAFVVAAIVGAIAGSAVASAQGAPADVESVTVASGQTLWSIAAELTSPGADVRDVMSQIVALNGLETETLLAGQQLTVPTGD